jgi:uncharacterized membrane protein YgdD (TMEM256/DUF423 family)
MKRIIIIASVLAALGVIIGAFGAHALKPVMTPQQLQSFETGVKYHLIHSIALLGIACLYKLSHIKGFLWSGYLMIFGIVLFSFSIYLLALKQLFGISHWTFLGPITPIGGSFLIISWILIGINAIKIKNE